MNKNQEKKTVWLLTLHKMLTANETTVRYSIISYDIKYCERIFR